MALSNLYYKYNFNFKSNLDLRVLIINTFVHKVLSISQPDDESAKAGSARLASRRFRFFGPIARQGPVSAIALLTE